MSTITPEALRDIALTIGLGERLTLIFVFGPGYLANEGLEDIERIVAQDHRVLRHRLDQSGPNLAETIAGTGEPRPVVLVDGLERMTSEPRQQLLVSMNLLRDTLSKRPAAVVIWIPVEIADEFRRLCVDLFHWRTLTVFVEPPEADDRQTRHDYLVALASAPILEQATDRRRPRQIDEVGECFVRLTRSDTPQAIDGWLQSVRRGLLLGPAGSGKTTALRRFAASRASALLDDGPDAELPVLVEARRLSGSAFTDLREGLTKALTPRLGNDAISWLGQRLTAEPAVVLIDGVDELPAPERHVLATKLIPLIECNPRVRIIVSSREAGTMEAWSNWQRAEIQPLDSTAIVRRLQSAGIDPEPLMAALSRASATGFAENPLSLELLIESLAGGTQPELELTDLIQSVVNSALEGWKSHKSVTRATSRSIPNLRTYLSVLAARMTRERTDAAPKDSALQLEDEFFGPVASPGEILDYLTERSGLLKRRGTEETGAAYAFAHRVFQDYFAGVWLDEHVRTPEQYAAYAADRAWQPAVTHALALLPSRQRTKAFWRIWEASNAAPAQTCWAMRSVALEGALHKTNPSLRAKMIRRATDAVQQARQAGQPSTLWGPVAELLERLDHAHP